MLLSIELLGKNLEREVKIIYSPKSKPLHNCFFHTSPKTDFMVIILDTEYIVSNNYIIVYNLYIIAKEVS